jgi:hypothetical protein
MGLSTEIEEDSDSIRLKARNNLGNAHQVQTFLHLIMGCMIGLKFKIRLGKCNLGGGGSILYFRLLWRDASRSGGVRPEAAALLDYFSRATE